MSAYNKILRGEETPLARAVKFVHDFCQADPQLAEKAAKELLALRIAASGDDVVYCLCKTRLSENEYTCNRCGLPLKR